MKPTPKLPQKDEKYDISKKRIEKICHRTEKLKIGNLKLESPIFLAPLAGYTDLAFRTIVRNFGHLGLAYSEMLSCRSIYEFQDRKLKYLIATSPEDHPTNWQIFGHEPYYMGLAAQWLSDFAAEMIDINMGCSVRKVLKKGSGSGLLKDIRDAEKNLKAVVKASSVPVTVKIRLGWYNRENWLPEAGKILENAGASAIALHARTPSQGFRGKADWEQIAILKDSVNIPVIGNGDIQTTDDALEMFDRTGCDAVMIGRGMLKTPWLARDIYRKLHNLPELPAPDEKEIEKAMRRHLEIMLNVQDRYHAEINFRKWSRNYPKSVYDRYVDILDKLDR
ncbi:MAG: tRNA dihydrouridine synthase [Candidatus Zixiibacteriota bacterium]